MNPKNQNALITTGKLSLINLTMVVNIRESEF